jgi:hypothetical protein
LHLITLGRISLDEWSALRRELYLTTQNSHKRQTSTSPVGFELAIPANERLQTHALDRAETLTDYYHRHLIKEDDMGGACSTRCLGKECIKTWRRHRGRQGHTQEDYTEMIVNT